MKKKKQANPFNKLIVKYNNPKEIQRKRDLRKKEIKELMEYFGVKYAGKGNSQYKIGFIDGLKTAKDFFEEWGKLK